MRSISGLDRECGIPAWNEAELTCVIQLDFPEHFRCLCGRSLDFLRDGDRNLFLAGEDDGVQSTEQRITWRIASAQSWRSSGRGSRWQARRPTNLVAGKGKS